MAPRGTRPNDRICALIRVVAERLIESSGEVVDELLSASQHGTRYPALVDDPQFAAADRRMNKAYLLHWLSANLQDPGGRVAPCVDPDVLQFARDVVRRGMDMNDLGSWRGAQHVAWDLLVDACFAVTADPAELRELLKVSERSMSTFVDDSIAELNKYVEQERHDLARGANAERHATVQLLLEGAPIGRARAESRLGYALTGSHVAAIVWTDSSDDAAVLDSAAERVMKVCGATLRLTLNASTAALWLWMPVDVVPQTMQFTDALSDVPAARVALGRPARDLDGFRRTHLDAAAAQRVLARVGSSHAVVRYEDVALVTVLTADMARAEQFVTDTLGDLATADPVLRATVLMYVRERFNGSSTAERMFTHRNTVERRLSRADQLLPQPLAENTAGVTAALMLVRLRDPQ